MTGWDEAQIDRTKMTTIRALFRIARKQAQAPPPIPGRGRRR